MKPRLIWLVMGLLLLAGCRQSTANKQVQVVASLPMYAEVAQAVLGTHGQATALINNPSIDPHDYSPTTKDAQLVAKADLAIENGAGYDTWMQKAITAAKTPKLSAATVVGVANGENEHIWYRPTAMKQMAQALAKRLSRLDPAHKAAYQRNAKRYIKRLEPLASQIAALKNHAHGQAVAVSEPVFDNALKALGYQVQNAHFAQAIEEGTDPSPKDIRELTAALQNKRVAFFVNNTQVQSPVVTQMVTIAKKAGVPVLNVTETMPAKRTYIQWMQQQYDALAKIQTSN